MSRLGNLLRSFGSQPGYTLMRGVARFENVRGLVAGSPTATLA